MNRLATNTELSTLEWWKSGVIYQIYPLSFQDSNGDGIGDLPGIIARLDHLQWLRVDAVWLSPIYPSPLADFGYDVSDYSDIAPIFGSLADFDRFMSEAHRRGIRVIMDFVANHSSDRHPWFIESRSARTSARRDWYLWRDPAPDGGPPNNWLSVFGGSAWTLDPVTGQYYYHAFLTEQPDLNWRNPAVRAAMHDALRFWMKRGVDGFRLDAIWHLVKDQQFRDNPPNPAYEPEQAPYRQLLPLYSTDLPEVHEVLGGLRRVADEYGDRLLIGEIYIPVERLMAYYGKNMDGLHLPFNFQLIRAPWTAQALAKIIAEYDGALPQGGWPNWVLGNHDKPRIATRVGAAQARVAAMLLLTLRGTPTIYYGDEIGMQDVMIAPEQVRDPYERNVPGLGLGRDPARTPMQWDATPHAGFTAGVPWLPLAVDFATVNVAVERSTADSLLQLYRLLIALRRKEPSLIHGWYHTYMVTDRVLAYTRGDDQKRFLVALNLGGAAQQLELNNIGSKGRLLLSTHLDREGEAINKSVALRAAEGVVIELN